MPEEKVKEILNNILQGDIIDVVPTLPADFFHTIVTSPPYWAARDYKIEPTSWPEITYTLFGMIEIVVPPMVCQLGLETYPEHFIGHMVHVFRLLRRVLRDDGTVWMNMGDCYNSKSGGYKDKKHNGYHKYLSEGTSQATMKINRNLRNMGLKGKDQVGIPWLLAFALRSDGWYLRQDIIWNKPNPMPESVNDRCTKAHEYIFLLSKAKKYYYDAYAISTEVADASVKRYMQDIENQKGSDRAAGGEKTNGTMKAVIKGYDHKEDKSAGIAGHSGYFNKDGELIGNGRANKKSVWTFSNKGTSEKHFATYPQELALDPIKASTSEHGCCASCGTPWVRIVDKILTASKVAPKTFVVDDRDHNSDKNDQGSNRAKDGHKSGHHYVYSNSQWEPRCECNGKLLKEVYHIEKEGRKMKRIRYTYTPNIPIEQHPVVPCRVLDPFGGRNTTGIVARKLGRDFVSVEKGPHHIAIAEKFGYEELGMFR
jgi:DNA modification methylase